MKLIRLETWEEACRLGRILKATHISPIGQKPNVQRSYENLYFRNEHCCLDYEAIVETGMQCVYSSETARPQITVSTLLKRLVDLGYTIPP